MWGSSSSELLLVWLLVLAAGGTEHVYRPGNMPATMPEWRELCPARPLPLPRRVAGRYLPDSRAGSRASGSSMSSWSGWASLRVAGWRTCTTHPTWSCVVGTSARWSL
ncbi:EGF like domain multiple 7 [Rhinolophus ferrumequinum]|uniref:EGF like domain multiple 7 n=1 Tax=Rhinolophus ferrumequinum TaxID=59479 RepID=A0A7J7VQC4_RHIFE|nr:EGF like domain multiple 7 [Rhinolophus ferrumequinum]